MFLYRRQISGRQLRFFIAASLAIMAHACLISIAIDPAKNVAPQVSLPRSVNVFLGQKTMLPKPEKHEVNRQKEIGNGVMVREPVTTVVPAGLVSPAADEPEKTIPAEPPVFMEPVKVKEPAPGEKIVIPERQPVMQETSASSKQPALEQQATVPLREQTGRPQNTETVPLKGTRKPGALQLAYPRYQLNAPPQYPGLSRKRGQQGTVILQVLVNGEGRVADLLIDKSSGFALLDRAALKAVKNWIFVPGRRHTEKVTMWVKVPVTFKLKEK